MAADIKRLLEGVQTVGSGKGQFNSRNRIRIHVYERRPPNCQVEIKKERQEEEVSS
jgi:hypothetical protein